MLLRTSGTLKYLHAFSDVGAWAWKDAPHNENRRKSISASNQLWQHNWMGGLLTNYGLKENNAFMAFKVY